MTEFEKMRSAELYNFADPEVAASISRATALCLALREMTPDHPDYRAAVTALIPGLHESSVVCTPFHCDHGHGISIGENTFVNVGATFLDAARVSIGARCKVGPNCNFFTAQHPTDYAERRQPVETALPITVGDDTWIAGGVTICPGVTIGHRCVIAAGSVVTTDIPSDTLAAGVPAKVKKKLA